MKHLCLSVLVAALLAAAVPALAELGVGDSRERVVEELGPPGGFLKADNYEILYYARGRVVIRDGAVSALQLVSEEELLRRQHAEMQEAELRKAREEEELLLQIARGEEQRQRLLNDPSFMASSAGNQVQVWNAFRLRYPGVDIREEYSAALEAYGHELDQREAEQRLKQLENRVAEAENRARQAEARAAQAEQVARERRTTTVFGGTLYPVVYPVRPVKPCVEPYVTPRRSYSTGINPMRLDYLNNRRVTPGTSYDYRSNCGPSVRHRSYGPVCKPSSGLSINLRL